MSILEFDPKNPLFAESLAELSSTGIELRFEDFHKYLELLENNFTRHVAMQMLWYHNDRIVAQRTKFDHTIEPPTLHPVKSRVLIKEKGMISEGNGCSHSTRIKGAE